MSESKSGDARLVAAVKRAAAAQLAPDAVEARVGRPATIRHWLDRDGRPLVRVDLAPDPAEGQRMLPLADARDVVYWVRSVEDEHHNPRVVGILWHPDGKAELFFAVVLPPE